MLPKKHRITVPDFFKEKVRSQKYSSSALQILVKKAPGQNPRFAIVIPKSVDKRSSFRNKIRRILEEEIRTHILQFQGNIYTYIKVLRVQKPLTTESLDQIKENLHLLLRHIPN